MKNSVLLVGLFVIWFNMSCTQDAENKVSTPEEIPFSAELLIDEMQIPWGLEVLPDGGILVTEKSGEIIHFKDGKKTQISNVPEVYTRGQGGLMDIKLHPNYESNGWIYISYASSEGEEKGGHTALMRAKLIDNSLTDNELLYKAGPNTTKGQHFGSRIEFDYEGFLYLSIGERGARDENPQDITRDGGKIYRFYDDGRIPTDNPFVGTKDAKEAIFSYGHRNPQGMVVHPETGEIWDNEHGPRGGDEINRIEAGKNYGWPKITYGINYNGTPITNDRALPGMEQPIHYWDPSIATSGMLIYSGDAFPNWKGNIFTGALKLMHLNRIALDENNKVVAEERLLLDQKSRIRAIEQGPDGHIYVATDSYKGKILKVSPR